MPSRLQAVLTALSFVLRRQNLKHSGKLGASGRGEAEGFVFQDALTGGSAGRGGIGWHKMPARGRLDGTECHPSATQCRPGGTAYSLAKS